MQNRFFTHVAVFCDIQNELMNKKSHYLMCPILKSPIMKGYSMPVLRRKDIKHIMMTISRELGL